VNESKHKTITVADSKGRARGKTEEVQGRKDNMNKKFWEELISCFPFATY
jgi:hypothetical protein